MPSRTRACVGAASRSRPSNWTPPPAALRRPITVFMSVVLPAPLRPTRPIIVWSGTESETPRRICTALMATLRLRSSSMVVRFQPPDDMAAHLGVGERDFRRGVGDDAAVVEGEHPLREAAYHFHVVLDEEHRRAFGAHRGEHHLHVAELVLRRDAAGGLVEQEHARPRDHRERDVEELAHAARQHLRVALAVLGEAVAREDLLGDLRRRLAVTRHRPRVPYAAAREEAA